MQVVGVDRADGDGVGCSPLVETAGGFGRVSGHDSLGDRSQHRESVGGGCFVELVEPDCAANGSLLEAVDQTPVTFS